MSAGFTTTYDPAAMILTLLGSFVDGYFDGTFITVGRDEDSFALKVGADGESARARNNNKAGKVVITLMQSSLSNDDLAKIVIADEDTGTGIGPMLLRDLLGTTVASCPDAFLTKPAEIKRGKEILGVEWTIVCPNLNLFPGGASPIP